MLNLKKTGILVAVLLVPVFVFLFLKNFGQNHYELRKFVPVGIDSTTVNGTVQYDTIWHKVPDFNLTDHNGNPVSQQQLNGIYIADFFFATCTTICPKMTRQMNRVQDLFKENPNVKLISYTVNPAQDTVEALKAYAEEYGVETGKWYLATGDKAQIYNLARKGYYLPVQDGSGDENDFIHSERLVLVDPNKNIRGFYDGTDPEEVDRLITEIRVLLHEFDLSAKE